MKWAGKRATLRTHYRALVRRCKSKDVDDHELSGTHIHDFEKTLKYVSHGSFSFHTLNKPNLSSLEKELKLGRAVILLHANPDGSSHYSFIIHKNKDGNFIGVNAFVDRKSVCIVPRLVMKFWIKKQARLPIAWVIVKKQV
jgi:hypothetical protein